MISQREPVQLSEQRATLEVTVLFTKVPATLRALKMAAELAHNLDGRIRLLVPQVVPYPLPLERPAVSTEFNRRRIRTLASQGSIDTRVELCLCRDRYEALCQALEPDAPVVMGVRPSWWPTAEKALIRKLRRKGYNVILVDSGSPRNAFRIPFGISSPSQESPRHESLLVAVMAQSSNFFHSISTALRTRRHKKFRKLLSPVDLKSSP
jgi:hypothetical protein